LDNIHTTFSRRGIIRRAAVITGGGAVVAAGLTKNFASAQDAKVTQAQAQYQTTPKDKAQCNSCASFIAPASCKLVSGTVSPSGWCALYVVKA
jgi:hypothetical protein